MADRFTEHFSPQIVIFALCTCEHSIHWHPSKQAEKTTHTQVLKKSLRWLIFQIKEVVLALKGKEAEDVQHLLL